MNHQEVFDHVVNHLLTQNAQSLRDDGNNDVCVYRASNGLKCAIGALIPDSSYDHRIETSTISEVSSRFDHRFGEYDHQIDSPLLHALQRIHDQEPISDWETALRRLAVEHGLIWHGIRNSTTPT